MTHQYDYPEEDAVVLLDNMLHRLTKMVAMEFYDHYEPTMAIDKAQEYIQNTLDFTVSNLELP